MAETGDAFNFFRRFDDLGKRSGSGTDLEP